MDEGARFPQVAAKAGHYESFYVKACQPGGGRGIWIRHTVHKRPGAEPNASIWFVLFDREAEGPRATKVTVPAAELSAPDRRPGSASTGAEIGPGRAEGSIETDALNASWDLTFSGDAEPCKYLPADWLYEAPLPKTKFVAPVPDARFDGRLEIDGEEIELDGWPGMIGHNWGSEHAERWVWLEGTGFAGLRRTPTSTPAPPGSRSAAAPPLDPLGDADARRRARTGSAASARSARPRSRSRRPPASSSSPARTSSSAAASPPRRRTSSAGSTPTPRAPSTTPSTARSPTSS